ncbi:hypothetical protein TNCV_4103291 [Trichonephila clavipes]|nr:hypothetical protein TNCV_4103291 [Trichonephila clavipes]
MFNSNILLDNASDRFMAMTIRLLEPRQIQRAVVFLHALVFISTRSGIHGATEAMLTMSLRTCPLGNDDHYILLRVQGHF